MTASTVARAGQAPGRPKPTGLSSGHRPTYPSHEGQT